MSFYFEVPVLCIYKYKFLYTCSFFYSQQPPLVVNGGEYSQRSLRSVAALSKETASHSRFPELKEEEIQSVADDIEARWKGAANITSEDIKRFIY